MRGRGPAIDIVDFRIERCAHGNLTGAGLQLDPAIDRDGAAHGPAHSRFDDVAGLVANLPAIAGCALCLRDSGDACSRREQDKTFKK